MRIEFIFVSIKINFISIKINFVGIKIDTPLTENFYRFYPLQQFSQSMFSFFQPYSHEKNTQIHRQAFQEDRYRKITAPHTWTSSPSAQQKREAPSPRT